MCMCFFFSSRRRHTRYWRDWSSDVCSSDLIRRGGAGGERSEASVAWEFGRPFDLDLRGTLRNALANPANAPGRRRDAATSIAPGDFAVWETEELTRASTEIGRAHV